MFHCEVLKNVVGLKFPVSAICLDAGGERVGITTAATGHFPSVAVDVERDVGVLISVDAVGLSIEDSSFLMSIMPANIGHSVDVVWQAFRCKFETGVEDLIAVMSAETAEDNADYLSTMWPGVRGMCVQEACHLLSDLSDDAMLWAVSQKVNASILVLDQDCKVIKANAAGRELLSEGTLLRNTAHGVVCLRDKETRALHQAIAECRQAQGEQKPEFVLMLRGQKRTGHVPLSLSLYSEPNGGARLFLAMLPMPPEQKRIEELAMRLGLTRSEARVAALMRDGYSNRQAAEIAGLKVETFNTYAKRVLSKMNVTCRAEMAQMLTWQSAAERSL
ncbi:DNA-binding transcriptional regulator, CsgD family [Sedimentitalea nanhaiensis]|uniref:DNA-binding transcriptional regulator, CsgD family n=1 Tax=Sedimentitalea nanhaiensis TaxID=999627 RepID=A0A1I7ARQ2_9RHOB|nr:DNA-binding transcriptional regulator, CsgD family [Sedimentitalea nanhaiensis]